jgi:hypothetical protein
MGRVLGQHQQLIFSRFIHQVRNIIFLKCVPMNALKDAEKTTAQYNQIYRFRISLDV